MATSSMAVAQPTAQRDDLVRKMPGGTCLGQRLADPQRRSNHDQHVAPDAAAGNGPGGAADAEHRQRANEDGSDRIVVRERPLPSRIMGLTILRAGGDTSDARSRARSTVGGVSGVVGELIRRLSRVRCAEGSETRF